MCLFKYREKRYGKTALILFGILSILASLAFGLLGVILLVKIGHWSKWLLLVLLCVIALISLVFGCFCLLVSTGMIWKSKSVRDGNRMKGVSGVRLCDKCGKVISKEAKICEHCGVAQQTGHGLKNCPACKAKNSATAKFCEKCGHEFRD